MVIDCIKHEQRKRGFTIVELLVVIVVIGILAAITIVSYAGISSKANTSSAQSAATNAISKVNMYEAEPLTSNWPATLSALTASTASTTTYYLPGVAYNSLAAAPATPNQLQFNECGTGSTTTAPASYATITSPSGVKVGYWNYTAGSVAYVTAGVTSGTVGTYNVACYPSGA